MNLPERIEALRAYSGLDISKFARLVGFKTPQAVRELLKGNTKKLSDAAFYKITKTFPNVNKEWLITGEGEMLKSPTPMDVDIDLKMGGHSQMAFRDINNGGNARAQMAVMQERIKSLEAQIEEKDARIAELTKVNNFLMERK